MLGKKVLVGPGPTCVCIEDLDALARSYFALSGTLAFTVGDDLIDSLAILCHDDTVTVSEDSLEHERYPLLRAAKCQGPPYLRR